MDRSACLGFVEQITGLMRKEAMDGSTCLGFVEQMTESCSH